MEQTEQKPSESKPQQKKAKKVLLSIGKWLGLLIIGTIIGIFIKVPYDQYRDSKKAEEEKKKEEALATRYIAVISSEADPNFTIPKEFKHGFGDQPAIITSKNQKIEIRHKDDQLSEKQTYIIAEELINDPNCVMIIGNSTSTLSDITLNSILNCNSKPPFILPIATADNLIEKSQSEGYKAILRMVPDNKDQSLIINRFITNKISANAKIVILVDEENQAYSNNLSKNIASGITDEEIIVLNKFYGNNNRFMPEFNILKQNGIAPDVIVYVGVSSNGILLIEELKALKLKIPVIFTDGCTVEALMKKAKLILGTNAYFLSAVSSSENGIKPTYEPIGKDAFTLANRILNAIDGPISREKVTNYISENKGNIQLNSSLAGTYSFDEAGNNKNLHFIIYTYQNGILTEVKGIK